jgi:hypothetical protein
MQGSPGKQVLLGLGPCRQYLSARLSQLHPRREAESGSVVARFSPSFRQYIALVMAMMASVGMAVSPSRSASEVSVFATLHRYRNYAAEIPTLQPKFASLMEDLDRRIQAIAKGVLAAECPSGRGAK